MTEWAVSGSSKEMWRVEPSRHSFLPARQERRWSLTYSMTHGYKKWLQIVCMSSCRASKLALLVTSFFERCRKLKSGFVDVQLAASSSIWDSTPDLIMQTILSKLDLKDQKTCRLVSKHWYYQIMEAITVRRTAFHNAAMILCLRPFVGNHGFWAEICTCLFCCSSVCWFSRHVCCL